jgi:hypothetical protein
MHGSVHLIPLMRATMTVRSATPDRSVMPIEYGGPALCEVRDNEARKAMTPQFIRSAAG